MPVQTRLVANVPANQCWGNLALDVGDCLEDRFSAESVRVAVAQLQGFELTR